jgi:hypothetical protein
MIIATADRRGRRNAPNMCPQDRPTGGFGSSLRWPVSWLAGHSVGRLPDPRRDQWLFARLLAAHSCGGSRGFAQSFTAFPFTPLGAPAQFHAVMLTDLEQDASN